MQRRRLLQINEPNDLRGLRGLLPVPDKDQCRIHQFSFEGFSWTAISQFLRKKFSIPSRLYELSAILLPAIKTRRRCAQCRARAAPNRNPPKRRSRQRRRAFKRQLRQCDRAAAFTCALIAPPKSQPCRASPIVRL